jgi:hypothetical protein
MFSLHMKHWGYLEWLREGAMLSALWSGHANMALRRRICDGRVRRSAHGSNPALLQRGVCEPFRWREAVSSELVSEARNSLLAAN